jgi:predicted nucleotidyltransferase
MEISSESRLTVPQGLTKNQFHELAVLIRNRLARVNERTGINSDDIFVQGSRAAGTAKPDSDIDIGIRVSPKQFEILIEERLQSVKPGSNKYRTLIHARERGRLFSGEAGLTGIRKEIELKFGIETDLSVIRAGGPFDNPPFIPLADK